MRHVTLLILPRHTMSHSPTSPTPQNSPPPHHPINPFIRNIHETLHAIYNPQDATFTADTNETLRLLYESIFSQEASTTIPRETLSSYTNQLVNSHIFETHLFPLIRIKKWQMSQIHVLYTFMDRFLFCVGNYGSDAVRRHVKQLFAESTQLWHDVMMQTADCLDKEMLKDAPWQNIDTRCPYSIAEMSRKALHPYMMLIQILNRVLEIEIPKEAFSTAKVENLHQLLVQRLQQENVLDFVILAAQRISQLIRTKRPDIEKRNALLSPCIWVLRCVSLIFNGEHPEEMVWACEFGKDYDRLLLSQVYTKQAMLAKRYQESLPTRHSRFGGKLVSRVNQNTRDESQSASRVIDSLQLANPNRNNMESYKAKPKTYAFRKNKVPKRLACEMDQSGFKMKSLLHDFAQKLLRHTFRDVMDFISSLIVTDVVPVTSKDMVLSLQAKEDFFRVCRFMLCVNRGAAEAKARARHTRGAPLEVKLSTEHIADYVRKPLLESFFQFLNMNADPQSRKNVDKVVLFQLHNLLEEAAGYMKEVMITLKYMIKNGNDVEQNVARAIALSFIHEQENIRSVVKLIRYYNCSKNSRLYLADLAELIEHFIQIAEHLRESDGDAAITMRKARFHTTAKDNDGDEDADDAAIREEYFDVNTGAVRLFARKNVIDKYAFLLKHYKDLPSTSVQAVCSMFQRIATFETEEISEEVHSVLYSMVIMNAFHSVVQDSSFTDPNRMEDKRNPGRLASYQKFQIFILNTFERMFTFFLQEKEFGFARIVFGEQRSMAADDELKYAAGDDEVYDEHQDTRRMLSAGASQEDDYQFTQDDGEQEIIFDDTEEEEEEAPVQRAKPKKVQRKRRNKNASIIDKLEDNSREVEKVKARERKAATEVMSDDESSEHDAAQEEEDKNALAAALKAKRSGAAIMDDLEDEIVFDDDGEEDDDNGEAESITTSAPVAKSPQESIVFGNDSDDSLVIDDEPEDDSDDAMEDVENSAAGSNGRQRKGVSSLGDSLPGAAVLRKKGAPRRGAKITSTMAEDSLGLSGAKAQPTKRKKLRKKRSGDISQRERLVADSLQG